MIAKKISDIQMPTSDMTPMDAWREMRVKFLEGYLAGARDAVKLIDSGVPKESVVLTLSGKGMQWSGW